ncbi:hypothetical protein VP150E351_P0061 [Vibrio phage 150E35-1]|nr:hypothetical protein VP150E351_P0061 [Vibrio phage 150E35-1]
MLMSGGNAPPKTPIMPQFTSKSSLYLPELRGQTEGSLPNTTKGLEELSRGK